MEASERPQLPFDEGGAGDGSVRAIDDRLVIERLEVADARAAKLVRERAGAGKAATETVRKAIEIGSRVLDSEETAANVDYVRRELEAGLGELDRRLGVTIEEGAETLAEQLARAFGVERTDSVQAQIKEIVTAESRQQREELLQRLTAEDPANPLVGLQVRIGKKMVETEERHRQEVELLRDSQLKESRAMQTQVSELKENLARLLDRQGHELELAEAEEAGTRKGITFEERVHEAIESIAGARGDIAGHTGTRAGRGWRQEGRHAGRDRRLRRIRAGPDRVRGKGQAADQEQGLVGAERGDGGPRRLIRGAGRRRRRERAGRPRAADRVRGQQVDRRRRSRGSERSRARPRLSARRRKGRDGPRPRPHRRCARRSRRSPGSDLDPEARAGDSLDADRDQDPVGSCSRRAQHDGRRRRGKAGADRLAGRRGRGGRSAAERS